MRNIEKEITEFLNISSETLRTINPEVAMKMFEAAEDDDFFELHKLGYEVNTEEG